MPAGRPSKLTHKITIPADGDEPERVVTCAERIYELMEADGFRAELCARDVGTTRKTIESWMAQGARAEEKADKGHLLYPQEQRFLTFLLTTRAMHQRWIRKNMALHASVAKGGLVLGEVTEEVDPTDLDSAGKPKVLKRRVKSSKALPDAQRLEWQLERLATDENGKRFLSPRVEVTGADGGPVTVEDRETREARLAADLLAFQQGADAQKALDTDREYSNGQGAE